ncbi:hypothetical protein K440DRAFT_283507 [Wilcoxina mikolae CBS 423.85]|nr:hypothetical protein K440DRAFT_283507 [Wilcoxina mikolae CBS 423.85]
MGKYVAVVIVCRVTPSAQCRLNPTTRSLEPLRPSRTYIDIHELMCDKISPSAPPNPHKPTPPKTYPGVYFPPSLAVVAVLSNCCGNRCAWWWDSTNSAIHRCVNSPTPGQDTNASDR